MYWFVISLNNFRDTYRILSYIHGKNVPSAGSKCAWSAWNSKGVFGRSLHTKKITALHAGHFAQFKSLRADGTIFFLIAACFEMFSTGAGRLRDFGCQNLTAYKMWTVQVMMKVIQNFSLSVHPESPLPFQADAIQTFDGVSKDMRPKTGAAILFWNANYEQCQCQCWICKSRWDEFLFELSTTFLGVAVVN